MDTDWDYDIEITIPELPTKVLYAHCDGAMRLREVIDYTIKMVKEYNDKL